MKRHLRPLTVLAALLTACAESSPPTEALHRAPPIPSEVDGVTWAAGNWEPFLPAGEKGDSWGNHRAVVVLDPTEGSGTAPDAILVTIPWRRHDPDPGAKSIVVLDAATGEPVANVQVRHVDDAYGEVIFQPRQGSTTYHVYYMPWSSGGGYYPKVTYPSDLAPAPDAAWAARVSALDADALPRARTTRIESVNDFHSFFPMEVAATPEETAAFMAGAPGGWRAVWEDRDRPVRMRRFIPHHWVDRAPDAPFRSRALRDEAFTFQVALVAGAQPLDDVEVSFERFPGAWVDAFTCFNCEGVDLDGRSFSKTVSVPAGEVQPLWVGLRVPGDADPGVVTGEVVVSTASRGRRAVPVEIEIGDAVAENHGYDEPELMTRLEWLNSTLGADADYVIEPFEPVAVDGRTLSVLGRDVVLGPTGLPESITSSFTPDVTGVDGPALPILARPLALEIRVGGEVVAFRPAGLSFGRQTRGRVEWAADNVSDRFDMRVQGALEYDGMLDYHIALVAKEDGRVDDIALPIAYVPEAAEYMLGLGRKGGRRPSGIDWKWAVENHQEGAWLGGLNRGLQYVLRDENYVRPLNTNFYRDQPLRMPPSWYNDGRGGIRIREEGGAVVADNYSGPRSVAAGDTLHFNVRFLVTPFKPIDTRRHFETRFVHQYVPVDSVVAWGGTVVNVHHANAINPYINYPFLNLDEQARYIEEAHAKGVKVKLYDTIRELTYHAHELFALRSLGHEIFNDGEGGGHSWLQEHLEDGYYAGWHAFSVDDAAILDKGTSRWTNYYIEGVAWLADHQKIDGLYLDDIAFSRETVKRLATVLDQRRPEVVIDLHSANQFNVRDGFTNSAMLYMEHFPYISRLWFGEYFDYDQDPDYWMTEVSGLPFGLMGEMLQDGGQPYRGLVYGMTARKYGETDPRPVWRMMDDFGISESRMFGYWLDDAPVQVANPRMRATAYARPGSVLIAIGSWSDRDETLDLAVDFEALGLSEDARAWAPAVEGLQDESEVDLGAVRVPAEQGLFVRVEG